MGLGSNVHCKHILVSVCNEFGCIWHDVCDIDIHAKAGGTGPASQAMAG